MQENSQPIAFGFPIKIVCLLDMGCSINSIHKLIEGRQIIESCRLAIWLSETRLSQIYFFT